MNSIHTKRIRQTFTVPQNIFQRFAAVVPARTRSAIVSKLLEAEARRREAALTRACDAANANTSLKKLEADFQALEDTVSEPFDRHAW